MRVESEPDGRARLVWTTDFYPGRIAEQHEETYDVLFVELVAAANAHRPAPA